VEESKSGPFPGACRGQWFDMTTEYETLDLRRLRGQSFQMKKKEFCLVLEIMHIETPTNKNSKILRTKMLTRTMINLHDTIFSPSNPTPSFPLRPFWAKSAEEIKTQRSL
jgi:hypothetical protein